MYSKRYIEATKERIKLCKKTKIKHVDDCLSIVVFAVWTNEDQISSQLDIEILDQVVTVENVELEGDQFALTSLSQCSIVAEMLFKNDLKTFDTWVKKGSKGNPLISRVWFWDKYVDSEFIDFVELAPRRLTEYLKKGNEGRLVKEIERVESVKKLKREELKEKFVAYDDELSRLKEQLEEAKASQ